MPEMKRNFTKGKMNKDLDERLVPPGEYRDAMNIQVSTSDESNVGTVQNILGNEYGCANWISSGNPIPDGSTTVGSISDERNDTLYWMVAGDTTQSIPLIADGDGDYHPQSLKDMIIRRNPSGKALPQCQPVFVDKYGIIIYNTDYTVTSFITLDDASLYEQINSGMTVTGFDSLGSMTFPSTLVEDSGLAPLPPIQIEYTSNSVDVPAPDGGGGSGSFSGTAQLPPVNLSANVRTFDRDTSIFLDIMGFSVEIAGPGKFNQFLANDISGNYSQSNLPPDGHVQLWLSPGTSLPAAVQVGAEVNAGPLFSSGEITNIQTTNLYASLNPLLSGSLHGPLYLITVQVNSALASPTYTSGALDLTDPNSVTSCPMCGEMFTYQDFNITVTAPVITTLTVDDLASPMISVPGNIVNIDPNSFPLISQIYDYIQDGIQVQVQGSGVWSGTGFNQACIDPTSISSSTDVEWEIVECDDNGIAVSPIAFGTQMFFVPISTVEAVWLEHEVNLSTTHTLRFDGERILEFEKDRLITGINFVDDMLFWTDNFSEPKKINIERSLSGTLNGNTHTKIATLQPNGSYTSNGPAKLEHVTVIKKPPHMPPTLKMSDDIREGLWSDEDGLIAYNKDANGDNEYFLANVEPGAERWMFVDMIDNVKAGFLVGDILKLASDQSDLQNSTLEHEFRVKILNVATNQDSISYPNWDWPIGFGTMAYLVEIISVSNTGTINSSDVNEWYVSLENDERYFFERNFPRFAYRYKYTDNEYSSFSPFSDVAFMPGEFNYESVKAYNTGMTNKLRSLTIQDFVPTDVPKDVVQVDILYKNETSPNVYIVDSINKYDSPGKSGVNAWQSNGSSNEPNSAKGSYKISTESIYSVLPENQLLRSWDNVPKKALAQEITANRLVYGNYFQGYNVREYPSANQQLVPGISVALRGRTPYEVNLNASKSIKSLRDYNIGIIWGDRYGRETPVIAPSSGSLTVPKTEADKSNCLEVSLDKSPYWADYYRFYVKETSNQYYNLAADRVYKAEDGNWWVSFPSVDRNKIDEDTYMVLKKGINSDKLIFEPNRYKVVAIENEAPEYIKTTYTVLAKSNSDSSRPEDSWYLWGGTGPSPDGSATYSSIPHPRSHPSKGKKWFTLDVNHWAGDYDTGSDEQMQLTSPIKLLEETNANSAEDELYVSFSKETFDAAKNQTVRKQGLKYKVVDAVEVDDADNDYYVISLGSQILEEDEFVTENMKDGDDNIYVTFWKKSVINKPEFDGRFFVKIYATETDFSDYLNTTAGIERDFQTTASIALYKIEDLGLTDSNSLEVVDTSGVYYNLNPGITNQGVSTGTSPGTRNITQWSALQKYGGDSYKSNWFIDNASFGGKQPLLSNDYKDSQTRFNVRSLTASTYFQAHASDVTSEVEWVDFASGPYFGAGAYMPGGLPTYNGDKYTENLGRGQSNGRIGMKGIHEVGDNKYIDISYSLLPPTGEMDPYAGTTKSRRKLNWAVGQAEMKDQQNVVGNLKIDGLFKFPGSEVVYKIKSVQKFKLYNYQGANTAKYASRYVKYLGNLSATFWNSMHTGKDITVAGLMWVDLEDGLHKPMVFQRNRRFTYRIKYEIDRVNTKASLIDSDDSLNTITNNLPGTPDATTPVTLDFLSEFTIDGENKISTNPAIFETEPKESTDIDLYYEASSSIPTFPITNQNKYFYIPIGSMLVPPVGGEFPDGVFVTGWEDIKVNDAFKTINLSIPLTSNEISQLQAQDFIKIIKDDGDYVTVRIHSFSIDGFNSDGEEISFSLNINEYKVVGLSWHNCWSFGNGVESNRIGDTFNQPFLTNGPTVSSVIEGNFKEEHRKYGLIYSGLYNSNSGINNLNQFIQAEKITKDINPVYGSIQKLHSRSTADGDLIALCEDRVLKILANKDALFNADGNVNLVSTNIVLGQATPYSGEYGISKNPESFASEAYRVYFTDKVRGAVMRLSKDGLTPISDFGMKDWFRDNLKPSKLIGSYDDKKDEYNITIKDQTETSEFNRTVSFKENTKGWVSFKSFIPENAISCANEYFTFKDGELWKHHSEGVNRNTFYNQSLKPSSISVILNDAPGSIKSFYTLNYEGSQSKVDAFDNYPIYLPGTTIPHSDYIGGINDGEYYNIDDKPGWYVENINTDKEEGSLNEFIEKEGKWFNYIKGKLGSSINDSGVVMSGFDNADNAFQGLGMLSAAPTLGSIFGCTDPLAFNYNSTSGVVDDGSCIAVVSGCMDPSATNFNSSVNTDDGSCIIYGCTTDTAINYNMDATFDDGSCIADMSGCTDSSQFSYTGTSGVPAVYNTYINYNAFASTTCDNTGCYGSQTGLNCCCEPTVLGCMQELDGSSSPMLNYDPLANQEPIGECIQTINGCMDITACNYDIMATSDDGSCTYCSGVGILVPDSQVDNLPYDANPDDCNSGCSICKNINLDELVISSTETTITVEFQENWDTPAVYGSNQTYLPAQVDDYTITITDQLGLGSSPVVAMVSANPTPGMISYTFTGLPSGEQYNIVVLAQCDDSLSETTLGFAVTQDPGAIISGCVDDGGIGNPYGTWGACNFDATATHDCAGNFAPGGGGDTTCCDYATCTGCTDPLYMNFCDTCWDATNQTVVPFYFDSNGDGIPDGGPWVASSDNVTGDIPPGGGYCTTTIVYGCNIPSCDNFDPAANVNDGSCVGCAFGGVPIYGCTNAASSNYDPTANVDDGSCDADIELPETAVGCPLGQTDSDGATAWNQTTGGGSPSDCEYCKTDPGVATATLSSNYDGANPVYTITWSNVATGTTNSNSGSTSSTGSLDAWGFYDATCSTYDQYDRGFAYRIAAKFKYPNGSTYSSWINLPANSKLAPSSGGCPCEDWATLPYNSPNDNWVNGSGLPSPYAFKFGKDNPIFGADDGRYDEGAHWFFYVKNTCHGTYHNTVDYSPINNCSVNGPAITTPAFGLPYIEGEPEE